MISEQQVSFVRVLVCLRQPAPKSNEMSRRIPHCFLFTFKFRPKLRTWCNQRWWTRWLFMIVPVLKLLNFFWKLLHFDHRMSSLILVKWRKKLNGKWLSWMWIKFPPCWQKWKLKMLLRITKQFTSEENRPGKASEHILRVSLNTKRMRWDLLVCNRSAEKTTDFAPDNSRTELLVWSVFRFFSR